ncbi:ABC transporter ATP-binding protein [Clostridium aciditolerans]|uniref:ABC transporter ATP-binding protein n=1 Tax=Clostridium aciditolerans TaxID=339861 RepID=A0A934I1J6_9CLOT|nr:ABC transporter ATP-binding protein [Clostridium aciditolerans]MBI6874330.1 ABC transporter ATP-binding protein [Clostridium aciditolerans]
MDRTKNDKKLVLKNVSRSFDTDKILNNISLEVREGEFVTLLGPSGSGKSTILNIISGVLKPDNGEVKVEGEISYMHQKDLLLPWKKVIDNVALPLYIKGKSKSEGRKQVIDYFEPYGLKGYEFKYPFQLSGGMKQRAAFLRTYMTSNNIMLLDEPFGALDAITRGKMQNWLLNVIKDLKSTILFITHDIEEAIYLSNRIYILSDKPACIKGEIKVDLPRNRTKDMITSDKFVAIKKQVLDFM